jgi:hypothetical protein
VVGKGVYGVVGIKRSAASRLNNKEADYEK